MQIKHLLKKTGIATTLCLSIAGAANAQSTDTTKPFVPHGKLWGYAFGDYAFKGSTDNIGTATTPVYRGGSNQYTGMPANASAFQWRRIYLGYNYEISQKFVAEFLLAAEDDFNSGLLNQSTGDVLGNGKFSPYVKLANIRWKNIFKNSDFVFGQLPTPTFAQGSALKEYARNTQTSEEVWGYRSIERTITDIRRTTSYDFGAALQGWFDNKGNYGYDVMIANGTGAKVEGDAYKTFYGDVYAKFMDKKLVVDLYQDYNKINWGTYVGSLNGPLYHDRRMTKLFVAYNTPKLTVGVEAFMNTLMGDVKITGVDGKTYYRTTKSTGVSVFAKGRITKESLGFFARFDNYDPTGNLSSIVSDKNTKSYSALTSQYDPTNKEMFATFGLDYTPIKNVHIMPNVWINTYNSGVNPGDKNSAGSVYSSMNSGISGVKGTDAVYRLTFYYIYGK